MTGNDMMSGNDTMTGNDTMSGADYNATAHGSGGLEGNAYNSTANNPILYNDPPNTSLMNSTTTTTTPPDTPPTDEEEDSPLVVSTTQYRVNGYQRVLLSLTYGTSNITQLWEAHDGILTVVPIPFNETGGEVSIDPSETPTATVSGGEPYSPMSTGTGMGGAAASNDTNAPYGGADAGITADGGVRPTTTPTGTPTSSMGYQVDAGVAGTSGRPMPVVNLDTPDVNHPGFVGPKSRLKAKRFVKGGHQGIEREGEVR
ncbi:MAG: hypothetical protein LQ350_008644 [Teloschistes chrysophthalmus]|nr:MAG: hypothetical protein LQ350_008644 [Niorma chrysophthalma]